MEKQQPSMEANHESHNVGRSPARRNLFVDLLAILFGISSWIGVTSSFLQLPIIVATAPEGWDLPSYIAVTVQTANIGSFAYVIYQKFSRKKMNDGYLIYLTLTIGCLAAICMAFFYQHTIEVNGTQHSVALLVFVFMFALVGCLSSVLFMPYMGRFRECYLVTYMCGMGLNGFLSSVMALIQGVGDQQECSRDNSTGGGESSWQQAPPLFGTKEYFLIVFAILVLSTIAFILLNNLKICKKEYASGTVANGNEYHYDEKEKSEEEYRKIPQDVRHLSTFNWIFLMAAVVELSGLGNGILPGLMTYSCLPYGSVAYHYAVTLAAIANPLAGFVAMCVPHISIRVIRILSTIGLALAAYIYYVALQSPHPPFMDSIFGSIFIVSSNWSQIPFVNHWIFHYYSPYFRLPHGQYSHALSAI